LLEDLGRIDPAHLTSIDAIYGNTSTIMLAWVKRLLVAISVERQRMFVYDYEQDFVEYDMDEFVLQVTRILSRPPRPPLPPPLLMVPWWTIVLAIVLGGIAGMGLTALVNWARS
jgi:hypothetical protein